jgi:hypothetical protein
MAALGQGPPGGGGGDDRSRKRKADGDPADSPSSKRRKIPANIAQVLRDLYGDRLKARIETIIRDMSGKHTVYKYQLTDPKNKGGPAKQSAKTIGPNSCAFQTGQRGFNNMHSEMVCVNQQLTNHVWMIPSAGDQSGQMVSASSNKSVPNGDFQTEEPHCGVCSIFLFLLGLPLGKPCVGKPNLGYLSYPLPAELQRSVAFLVRLLGSLDFLKEIIQTMLGLEGQFILQSPYPDPLAGQNLPVVQWTTEFCVGQNLKNLWDFIKEMIYEVTTDESKSGRYGSPFGQ